MNEKDIRRVLRTAAVLPLVKKPTFTDTQVKARCYKLATEILSREKGEVKPHS